MGETERRRGKGGSREEMEGKGKKKAEERKNHGSKENSRGVGNLG